MQPTPAPRAERRDLPTILAVGRTADRQAEAPIRLSRASATESKRLLRPISGCTTIALSECQRIHRLIGLSLV
jgi:hypothetical protein